MSKTAITFYKLKAGNKTYYGSTEKPIEERLRMHWYMLKSHHMGNYRRMTSFNLLESGEEVYILPLLKKNCTKEERREIEGNYIRQGKENPNEECQNIRVENRTPEETKEIVKMKKLQINIMVDYE